jgi:dethiobiotin synthetase
MVMATGTHQGKTFVTSALMRQLQAASCKAIALKPIVSGYAEMADSDPALLLASMNQPITEARIQAISPWRFAAALSPDIAAAQEGRAVSLSEVVTFCTQPREAEIIVIEGAGGVMSPLTSDANNVDLALALTESVGASVVLVSGCYLGCISHLLTAFEVLHQRGVQVVAVVLSQTEATALAPEIIAASLLPYLPAALPVIELRYAEDTTGLIEGIYHQCLNQSPKPVPKKPSSRC